MADQSAEKFEDRRYEFLKTMYSEMWGNVNRHLLLIWQSVGVLGGALAVFSLTEKEIITVDVASSVVVILCAWLISNAYVSSAWFNRNQAIISNIERQFLRLDDLVDIEPYFRERRNPGNMIEHILLQWWLGLLLGIGVLVGDFVKEIWPSVHHLCSLGFIRWIPFITGAIGVVGCVYFRNSSLTSERDFLSRCPIRN
jgi:low affinity Fe/Cu permease